MRSNLLKQMTSVLTARPPKASLAVLISILSIYGSPSQAIVGGELVPESVGLAKHTVAIYDSGNSSTCSGTLITPEIVVTAAHCLIRPKEGLTVIFATDSVANLENPAVTRKAIATKISPDFSTSKYGDIGLIRLSAPAPEGFTPAPFATSATTPDGIGMDTYPKLGPALPEHIKFTTDRQFLLAGYGFYEYKTIQVDRYDPRLEPAIAQGLGGCNNYKTVCKITLVSHDKKLRATVINVSSMNPFVLITDETHGRGSCYGDSGGPTYAINENKQLILVGITSGGDAVEGNGDCGDSPGIKTLVSHYAPWIEAMIKSGF